MQIPRAKDYSTLKVLLLLILAVSLGVCAPLVLLRYLGTGSPPAEATLRDAILVLQIPKHEYVLGEPVQLGVSLIVKERTAVDFSDAAFNLTVISQQRDANDSVYYRLTETVYRTVLEGGPLQTVVLAPNSSYLVPVSITWDQKRFDTHVQVQEGEFLLRLDLLPYNITAATTITVRAQK